MTASSSVPGVFTPTVLKNRAGTCGYPRPEWVEAALAAGRASLQVHGAIGYTYEQDVHVWMKRAWSLDLAFGDSVFHRNRLCAGVIDRTIPAESFGYSPPGN